MVYHEFIQEMSEWITDCIYLWEDRSADEEDDLFPNFRDGVLVYIGTEDNQHRWLDRETLEDAGTNVYERLEHAIMSSM